MLRSVVSVLILSFSCGCMGGLLDSPPSGWDSVRIGDEIGEVERKMGGAGKRVDQEGLESQYLVHRYAQGDVYFDSSLQVVKKVRHGENLDLRGYREKQARDRRLFGPDD